MAATDRQPAEPSKKSKKATKEVDEFLRKAVKRFGKAEGAESKNRQMATDDLKFKAGEQWPEDIKAKRTIEKRPCLTINKIPTFVHQLTNDQRQNRPSIKVSPVGDGDKQASRMLTGMIRHIERVSHADLAYDTGFESAVSNGWGYWRICTEYEEDDSFNQCIRIDRIRNPFRVYLDPAHQDPTGKDAKWAFITDLITREEYDALYKNAPAPSSDPPQPWTEGGIGDEYKLWSTESHVRIAEYFYQERKTRKLVSLTNGHTGWEDELAPSLKNAPRRAERDVEVITWKCRKITCKDILEEYDWAGKYHPIVKCVGDESDIEGKPIYSGIIRHAKDPQRMYNFWTTSETELIALAPKAPYIMEEGQVEGFEQMWQKANTDSLPYLLYKGSSVAGHPAPPPQRQQFAGPPAGVIQAKIAAAQDMQATTGIRFDATLQERNYDESGKALKELQRVGNIGNFHYVDNLARSLRHTGDILIDLIPKIYDTRRTVTILREDDSEERVDIDPQGGRAYAEEPEPNGGSRRKLNPKLGRYAVTVTVGPSYATKRQEAADSILGFLKVFPQAAQVAGDLIAKNMDWPGADEIAARLQTLLPPGMLDKQVQKLPPEARGLVMQLSQQMQQMKQERDQAVALLGDKDKDRAIDAEKISKDFEAKMAKIFADFETKMAAVAAKQGESPEERLAQMVGDFELKINELLMKHSLKEKELQLKAQGQEQKMAVDAEMAGRKQDMAETTAERSMALKEKQAAQKPKERA